MKIFHEKQLPYFGLLVVLIFAAIIRFYNLGGAGFDYDQEYAANFAYSVVREYPIQMIGQGLSIEGLFMGPWYFYYLTPFFMMTQLHPIGGLIGSVLLGLVTICVYFYVFKSVFGVKAAIVASVLRAGLFSFIGTDLSMTPAFSADLPALLTWFCFYKLWNKQFKYLIGLSFLFGLYTSYHPILFPFYFVFIGLLIFKRYFPGWKIIGISIVAFLIPISPLIRFEYYHEFWEVKKLLNLGSRGESESIRDLPRLIEIIKITFGNALYTFFGVYSVHFTSAYGKLWGLLAYIPLLALAYAKSGFWKNSFHRTVFFLTYFIFVGYYFFLPVNLTEYYLLGINTVFFIYAIASFSLIKNNRIVATIVGLLVFVNIFLWYQESQRESTHSLSDKENIIKQIGLQTLDGKPFFVSYITHPGFRFGYPYLFKILNVSPSNDPQPRTFNIVSPRSMVGDKFDFESGDIGLIFPK